MLGYASGEGRGSLVRVRDARRLTRAPSNLATFDLRAETMFWAVENPSPSISKCLDGGFCELYEGFENSIDTLPTKDVNTHIKSAISTFLKSL